MCSHGMTAIVMCSALSEGASSFSMTYYLLFFFICDIHILFLRLRHPSAYELRSNELCQKLQNISFISPKTAMEMQLLLMLLVKFSRLLLEKKIKIVQSTQITAVQDDGTRRHGPLPNCDELVAG